MFSASKITKDVSKRMYMPNCFSFRHKINVMCGTANLYKSYDFPITVYQLLEVFIRICIQITHRKLIFWQEQGNKHLPHGCTLFFVIWFMLQCSIGKCKPFDARLGILRIYHGKKKIQNKKRYCFEHGMI